MCISYCDDLALVILVLMLLEEGVIHEFLDSGSLIWVFLQALIQKIPDLGGYIQVGRYLDFILYDFY